MTPVGSGTHDCEVAGGTWNRRSSTPTWRETRETTPRVVSRLFRMPNLPRVIRHSDWAAMDTATIQSSMRSNCLVPRRGGASVTNLCPLAPPVPRSEDLFHPFILRSLVPRGGTRDGWTGAMAGGTIGQVRGGQIGVPRLLRRHRRSDTRRSPRGYQRGRGRPPRPRRLVAGEHVKSYCTPPISPAGLQKHVSEPSHARRTGRASQCSRQLTTASLDPFEFSATRRGDHRQSLCQSRILRDSPSAGCEM
jgi:hypothetical protein